MSAPRSSYNEFNHLDRDEDKLVALHLPLTADQRIEVAFRAAPQRRVDALAVLIVYAVSGRRPAAAGPGLDWSQERGMRNFGYPSVENHEFLVPN